MRINKSSFSVVEPWPGVSNSDWQSWTWQMQKSLKTQDDFEKIFDLTQDERLGFVGEGKGFRVQTTPYYASLVDGSNPQDAIRKIILPLGQELQEGWQQMPDPLGENLNHNRPCQRLVHRYTDRALFLATDLCGIYCRYCTRKHFTASDQVMASDMQLQEAVSYVRSNPQIKEVIFSGGDPLTLSDGRLQKMIEAFYEIESLDLIRIGSRMPVVNPMRIQSSLIDVLKNYQPLYFMVHFNHPDEITSESARALTELVDNGIPVFNQMVLLKGVNNHPALIYALSRRLLKLRVKPHYMFQADPSMGTDHLRISIDEALKIQKELWGHTSGLAMPQYIVDIPSGGGKAAMVPDFQTNHQGDVRSFKGWDGVKADYISPPQTESQAPFVDDKYLKDFF